MSYDHVRNEGGSSSRQAERPDNHTLITGRNVLGQYVSLNKDKQLDPRDEYRQKENKDPNENRSNDKYEKYEKYDRPAEKSYDKSGSDVSNMLRHIESLEKKLQQRDSELTDAKTRVEKFSQRTREDMQSALDSLMKKWMDAVETKDETCKEEFKKDMEKLVQNSAEDNGVWQMMVAASSLHEKQEHNLDQLRLENNELKQKIDGHYATPSSRMDNSLGKRKTDEDIGPESVGAENTSNIWEDFAKDMSSFKCMQQNRHNKHAFKSYNKCHWHAYCEN
jgi:cell division protein FtsB